MKNKNVAVFGIYSSRAQVESVIERLRTEGFTNSSISVLFPENLGARELALKKETKAPEGTVTGVGSGALLGGTVGWLAGIGILAIPGFGPLIAAGPIMAALAGASVGGGVGGVLGALAGFGIPEYEAKRYTGRIKEGGILLSVHCDNAKDVERAKETLKQTDAQDIASSGESSVPEAKHRAMADSHRS